MHCRVISSTYLLLIIVFGGGRYCRMGLDRSDMNENQESITYQAPCHLSPPKHSRDGLQLVFM